MHEAFTREWEANLDSALSRAMEPQKKGYLVEEALQRGALVESQAKKSAGNLKALGCAVKLIPIASWSGEKVVFLVYKPLKEGESVTPTAKPPPKTRIAQLKPEEIIERFVRYFKAELPVTAINIKLKLCLNRNNI